MGKGFPIRMIKAFRNQEAAVVVQHCECTIYQRTVPFETVKMINFSYARFTSKQSAYLDAPAHTEGSLKSSPWVPSGSAPHLRGIPCLSFPVCKQGECRAVERLQQERPHRVPRCAAGTCPGPTPCKADHRHLALEQSIPAPNAPHLALNPNPTRCARRPRRPKKQQAWPALSLSVPGALAHVECSDTGPLVRAAKGPQLIRRINVSDCRTAARPSLQAQHTRPLGGQGASGGPEHLLAAFCPRPSGAQLAQCRVGGFLCPLPTQGGSARLWTVVGKSPRPVQRHQVTHTYSF